MLCQAKKVHVKGDGCGLCGGYGYIAEFGPACSKCNKKAWFRPGAWTSYVGKHYRTLDGLELIVTALADEDGNTEIMCADCAPEMSNLV